MRKQLMQAMKHQYIVTIIYMAKDGAISKRAVKILKITGATMQVYCFHQQAQRTFIMDNVLSAIPIVKKEQEVIV